MNEEQLYIPIGIKPRNEFFSGFGGKELAQSAVFMAFGGAACAAVCLLTASVAATVTGALTVTAVSVMVCVKDTHNQSVVDQIHNLAAFADSQKIYPYRRMNEWGG